MRPLEFKILTYFVLLKTGRSLGLERRLGSYEHLRTELRLSLPTWRLTTIHNFDSSLQTHVHTYIYASRTFIHKKYVFKSQIEWISLLILMCRR